MFDLPDVTAVVAAGLAEDLGVPPALFIPGSAPDPTVLKRDVTSASSFPPDATFSGLIVAREDSVVCGLPVANAVWDALCAAAGDPGAVEVFPLVAEGTRVVAGTPVAEVDGRALHVLAGERTALDFVGLLSGIASEAARWQTEAGPHLDVCDTRKTVPGLRELSKYAVRVGGATNHRAGLYDMVLIKDNHVAAAGGITPAVARARELTPGLLIEVEADTVSQAVEAVHAGADIVMLDNFADADLPDAVAAVRVAASDSQRLVVIEVSGGVRFERLAAIAASGADRVSASALTLVGPKDFALDVKGS